MSSREEILTWFGGKRRLVMWCGGVAVITVAVLITIWATLIARRPSDVAQTDVDAPALAAPTSTAEPEESRAAIEPALSSAVYGPDEGEFDGTTFLATFDGDPSEPQPFNPGNWDVTVHSRDPDTWESLDPIEADHGATCSAPPDTHPVTAYEDATYQCKNHMMTAIRGDGYGLIYLTPPYQVDFSADTAVISFDVSTLRTSVRDWWDIWISPYDDALQLPLDREVDLSGPPKNGILVSIGTENQMVAEIFEDFAQVEFPDWPNYTVSGDSRTGYETFLEPDSKRRDTVEIHISPTHLKVGMPQYDFWWIDSDIPELAWTTGVVQFGHHSYNPYKDCNVANNPRPPVDECRPNTWHWDNVSISPAVPFSIVRAEQRTADPEAPVMSFVAPAPPDATLRFAGIGVDMMVRFDDGAWQPATVQETEAETVEEHFASYWVDVPAGTIKVEFRADDWRGRAWQVRDASFWSPET